MSSLNKVMLIGHTGKDPELSYTPSGVAVCKVSLATTERWKDQDGNKQERTDWHNIVAWRKLAELIGEYVKKGSKIYIEGKIQTRSWDDQKTGTKKYITEIIASSIIFLDQKTNGGGGKKSASSVDKEEDDYTPPETKDDLPF